jgi:hypothetical protein
MKVREGVSETWTKMQKRCRGLTRHPGVAVRRSGTHPLEQAQDTATTRDAVERSHEVHFRRAGIHEAELDAVFHQRLQKAFRTGHG